MEVVVVMVTVTVVVAVVAAAIRPGGGVDTDGALAGRAS